MFPFFFVAYVICNIVIKSKGTLKQQSRLRSSRRKKANTNIIQRIRAKKADDIVMMLKHVSLVYESKENKFAKGHCMFYKNFAKNLLFFLCSLQRAYKE